MKKLFAAIAMAAVVAAGASAITLDASAGFAYGFSDLSQKDSDTGTKTERIDNAIGAKLAGTLYFFDDLGFRLDASFLFPTKGTTFKTTLSNGNTSETKQDYDGAFVFNGFMGPVYKFKLSNEFSATLGIGFDLAYNSYSTNIEKTILTPKTKVTNSFMSFGIGATADACYMVNKNMGVKLGLTFGYLWGNQVQVKTEPEGKDSTTNTKSFEANGLYLIPDFSFVYKF